MKITPFPGSNGLKKNEKQAENYHAQGNRPLYLNRKRDRGDEIEISAEAKIRFEHEKILRLDRIKLKKEAETYFKDLKRIMDFSESDLRRTLRPDRVDEAEARLKSGFYDYAEKSILKKIADKIFF